MPVSLGTVAPIGFEEFPPAEWLACFRRLGCAAVQAYRNQQARVTLQQMKDAIASGGMPCDSLHGIFGEQFDPSCPDERARRFAVEAYKAEGQLALELGGPLVVVHCSTIRRDGVGADERRRRVDQIKRSIEDLGRVGQSAGVTYAFENLPPYHPVGSDVAELAAMLRDVAAPNTGMCFDTGHANIAGDPVAAAGATGGQMIYVHMSDNSGQGDEHEMPTYGSIDFDALARKLKETGYHGTMMLEVFHPVDRVKALLDDGCADRLARILALANGA